MTERLRLAAALAHQVDQVAVTLWRGGGPAVVVARCRSHLPDLSPCDFRSLVLSGTGGLLPADEVTVEGQGVLHVGDGVVSLGGGRWCWATLLDGDAVVTTLGAAAADLVDRYRAPVEQAEVRATVDADLGATVVGVTLPPDVDRRHAEGFLRALARACTVDELLQPGGGDPERAVNRDGGPDPWPE